ncbi:GH24946 [Drosophila grimshawi]|uniref:GH24946 n=1 Tax=Drosophila grimshawi TaxID=7222 RepID=B4K0D4_DROGR|nr:GH24946 [Drosophila grimshawi]
MEHQTTSVDVSGSASGRRQASDPKLFGRPSEAGVSCDEGAGPGARAASGRRPRRPLRCRVRLVREVRVVRAVRVERPRVLRRIAQEQRNRQSDELELLAQFPSVDGDSPSERDEGEGASPPHAPLGEDAVVDAVPEADEEALPRCRRYPSDLDDVNPEWLRWQYPELPRRRRPTPPRHSSPDHVLRGRPLEASVIPGVCLGGGGGVATHLAAGEGTPPRRPQLPATTTEPNTARSEITTTPAAGVETPIPAQGVVPRGGTRPTRPTLQRQSSDPEGEAGWQELPPPAWPPGIMAMADAQPGPSRRASRIVWQEGHRYRVKTSKRGTRVFRKV